MAKEYDPLKNLGRAIRIVRAAREYSPPYVAKQAGLSRSYYFQIEKRKKIPSISALERIAKALDIDLANILVLAEPKDSPHAKILKEAKHLIYEQLFG